MQAFVPEFGSLRLPQPQTVASAIISQVKICQSLCGIRFVCGWSGESGSDDRLRGRIRVRVWSHLGGDFDFEGFFFDFWRASLCLLSFLTPTAAAAEGGVGGKLAALYMI
uniref:Uncharacterized protein n=1 Tax=Opuntia streptacantha TaxID=393608 RepID=A0A7C9DIP5_OPUST